MLTLDGYKSSVRLVADQVERLDRFLARCLRAHTRSRLQEWIAEGHVRVEGEPTVRVGFRLKPGWIIELEPPAESAPHDLEPASIPLDVAYEDDCLLVVNKPRSLATHPAASLKEPTLVNALLARRHPLSEGFAPYRPGIVHRLDKDTTGLIVVAKTDSAHASLSRQIESKSAKRVYVALVEGEPFDDEFTVDAPLGRSQGDPTKMSVKRTGKHAVTHCNVLRRLGQRTLLLCRLETGRTHQIRVHLAACHMPVVGDAVYGQCSSTPLQLHAALLEFVHPVTGRLLRVYASPPEDFLARGEVRKEEVERWIETPGTEYNS